ncbi:MAG: lipid A biosynthesis acyltransferase [Flavobacteriales bacterium]|nr:lipid A biosynthesis acyltransferase [Flavobacteriales bacterium]
MKRIAFLVLYPFLLLISLLPFSILYILSNIISFTLFYIIGYRRKMIKKNLTLSFPNLNINERNKIERKFYTHMCDIFLEMIKSMTISLSSINNRFRVNNMELLTQFPKNNRSVIIICGHYASYEWMLFLANDFGASTYGIYTPLSNQYFDKLVKKIRVKHNAYLISRYHTIDTIRKHQDSNHRAVYGFAADQSPYPKKKTYWRSFMGNKVPVFTGAERLAIEHNIPVVYADIKRVDRGFYEVDFKLISDFPKETKKHEITDIFFNLLEESINRDPSQYLWSHNRYKHLN